MQQQVVIQDEQVRHRNLQLQYASEYLVPNISNLSLPEIMYSSFFFKKGGEVQAQCQGGTEEGSLGVQLH